METLIVGTLVVGALLFLLRRAWRSCALRSGTTRAGCAGCQSDCALRRSTTPRAGSRVVGGLLLASMSAEARAADTIETWPAGAFDLETYVGYSGITQEDAALTGDVVLGYGLTERLSTFIGTGLELDQRLVQGTAHFHFGGFGTLVDGKHVDVDLLLVWTTHGPAFDAVETAPAVEVNLDFDGLGVYLRSGTTITLARAVGPELMLWFVPGVYWQVADGHQILLEWSIELSPVAWPSVSPGAVALGYNVGVTDAVELVTQVSLQPPHQQQPLTAGIMTGLIASLTP